MPSSPLQRARTGRGRAGAPRSPAARPPTASPRPEDLARRFLAGLAAAAAADAIDPGDADDRAGIAAADRLADGVARPAPEPRLPPITIERAAAAVRLASTLASHPDLLAALAGGAPVFTLATGDPAWVEPVVRALLEGVLPPGTRRVASYSLDDPRGLGGDGPAVVILEPKGAAETRDPAQALARLGAALRLGHPVIGVAADPAGELHPDLRQAADLHLALAPLDAAGLGLAIEAATGEAPDRLPDEAVVRGLALSDLRLSVLPHRGGARSLARLEALVRERLDRAAPPVRLETLCGYGEARAIGLGMAADLRAYKAGALPWRALDRGLLLVGPPGTGKTLFARAFAASAGLPLVTGSLAAWQASRDGHLGHTLGAMRASFAEALAKAPSVLFIDEIDSFDDRARLPQAHANYSRQVVNGLLELLDGAGSREGLVVLAATNHAEVIDPAIRRAGRLDRTVAIGLPDHEGLIGILRHHLGEALAGVDLTPAALAAAGGSGADCAAWVRQACGTARRAGRPLALADLVGAIGQGRPRLPEGLRRRIAVHEAGHAVAAVALGLPAPHALAVTEAGGRARMRAGPEALTNEEVHRHLVQLLAGRAAEALACGAVSAGAGGDAHSDLARATALAAAAEASFGLGAWGPLWLGAPADILDPRSLQALAPQIGARLQAAEADARGVLAANRGVLEAVAEALLARSYLDEPVLERLLAGVLRVPLDRTAMPA